MDDQMVNEEDLLAAYERIDPEMAEAFRMPEGEERDQRVAFLDRRWIMYRQSGVVRTVAWLEDNGYAPLSEEGALKDFRSRAEYEAPRQWWQLRWIDLRLVVPISAFVCLMTAALEFFHLKGLLAFGAWMVFFVIMFERIARRGGMKPEWDFVPVTDCGIDKETRNRWETFRLQLDDSDLRASVLVQRLQGKNGTYAAILSVWADGRSYAVDLWQAEGLVRIFPG